MGIKVKPTERWEYGITWESESRDWENITFNTRESKPAKTMVRET